MFWQYIRKIAVVIGASFVVSAYFPIASYGEEISDLRTLNALRILQQRAEAGNVKAQYLLGHVYWHGIGVEQDYAKAVEWIEKAAFQGDADAEDALGLAYSSGMGVKEQNYFKAKELFEKSAFKGSCYAQAHLADLYARGAGVDKDCRQAKYWLEKSIHQNCDEGDSVLKSLSQKKHCF